jgi:hypothetical protein
MPVLNSGQWEAPFWGASKTFISGQDMLGMQNASTATYAVLLPGLTNLTRRIRYYGFYMWLLEQYAKTKGKVSVSEFQRFIRRGELLLAFVMAHNHNEELGIVGSLYARNRLQKAINPIDIAAGADRENEDIYWQYSSGAFGQYYQGALSAIGLIAPSEKENRIFVCTENYGRKLAELFEATIEEKTRKRYLEAINKGRVTREELKSFGVEFSITAIQPHSAEWNFYITMLFGQDFPTVQTTIGHTSFRVETILLYLEYLDKLNNFESAASFPESFQYRLWDTTRFSGYTACTGWHYYALNEFAHYSLETILWACLVEIRNQGIISLSRFILEFTEKTNESLRETNNDSSDVKLTFGDFAESIYNQGFDPARYTDIIDSIDEDNVYVAVVHALYTLAQIYKHDNHQIPQLNGYARKHGMYREGDVTELLSWIQKNETLSMTEFFRKLLLQNVLNRHIEVAMRKMRNRNENTLKFIIEDNLLKPVDIASPVWTSPRLDSLHQFLVDLKLVDNNALSPLGKELIRDKMR